MSEKKTTAEEFLKSKIKDYNEGNDDEYFFKLPEAIDLFEEYHQSKLSESRPEVEGLPSDVKESTRIFVNEIIRATINFTGNDFHNLEVQLGRGSEIFINHIAQSLLQSKEQEIIELMNAIGYNYDYKGDGKWTKKEFEDTMLVDVREYTTSDLLALFRENKK